MVALIILTAVLALRLSARLAESYAELTTRPSPCPQEVGPCCPGWS
jgi:hypothetical protein